MTVISIPDSANILINTWGGIIGLLWCAFILAIFLYFRIKYLPPLRRVFTNMRSARLRLEDDSTDPTKCFPETHGHLYHLWNEFLNQRRGTTVFVFGQEVSTIDIEEIFTEERVLEGYNRNLAVTVAGVLTGLGILGTFLGLIIGMAGLGTEIVEMVENIGQLLSGMWAAFLTSVVGIACSLWWLVSDRSLLHNMQRETARFFTTVRQHFPVESTDRLLHRLLTVEQEEKDAIKDSKQLLEEQNSILQSMSFDLAAQFANALDQRLTERLTPAFESMTATLQSLAVQFGERHADAMQYMVDSFQKKLSENLENQFNELANAIAHAAEWQGKVHRELETLVDRVQEACDRQLEVIDHTREASNLFVDSIDELGAAHDKIARTSSGLNEVSERVRSSVVSLLEQLDERTRALLESMSSALEHGAARISSLTADLDSTIRSLRDQQEIYREANEEIRTALATQIDAIDEQVRSLVEFWSSFEAGLEELGNELKDSVSTFSSITTDRLRQIFASFDAEMAKVVDHLAGTLAEIRDVTDELPSSIHEFQQVITSAVTPISDASRSIGELTTSLKALNVTSSTSRASHPTTPQDQAARVVSTQQSESAKEAHVAVTHNT